MATMVDLALTFPSMRRKAAHSDEIMECLKDFDALRMHDLSLGWSSGEKLVVHFLCAVWNYGVWGGKFDCVRAITIWDREHQAAFAAWAKDPFVF